MLQRINKRILVWLPAAFWVLQLELLTIHSLWAQTDVPYIDGHQLGIDFQIFPIAYGLRCLHVNPYLYGRYVAPPFSLLVGQLANIAGHPATKLFFLLNMAFVLGAVWLMARHFGVAVRQRLLLMAAALTFYPVLFLFDRGNLDGIMLILFAFAIVARPVWLRTLLIGLSINIKLYTVVITFAWFVRRAWRSLILSCVWATLLVLPFADLLLPFLQRMALRVHEDFYENLSPAFLFGSLMDHTSVKLLFFVIWLGTLVLASRHFNNASESRTLAFLTPWMASMPIQVWPYTGVMVLALYCAWLGERGDRDVRPRDILLALGLALIGIQQHVLNVSFTHLVHAYRFFPALTALGTAFLMAGSVLPVEPMEDAVSHTAMPAIAP